MAFTLRARDVTVTCLTSRHEQVSSSFNVMVADSCIEAPRPVEIVRDNKSTRGLSHHHSHLYSTLPCLWSTSNPLVPVFPYKESLLQFCAAKLRLHLPNSG